VFREAGQQFYRRGFQNRRNLTAESDAQRDVVYAPYQGVLYFQNIALFYSTRVNVTLKILTKLAICGLHNEFEQIG
jgi:hypothetical protein